MCLCTCRLTDSVGSFLGPCMLTHEAASKRKISLAVDGQWWRVNIGIVWCWQSILCACTLASLHHLYSLKKFKNQLKEEIKLKHTRIGLYNLRYLVLLTRQLAVKSQTEKLLRCHVRLFLDKVHHHMHDMKPLQVLVPLALAGEPL